MCILLPWEHGTLTKCDKKEPDTDGVNPQPV